MSNFRVICVKQHRVAEDDIRDAPRPEVGDIDTVIKSYWSARNRDTFYNLERFGMDYGYLSDYFAILPDQSADEMQEEKHEAIIYQR